MKIIFDTFERALEGTVFEKNIRELFKYFFHYLGEFHQDTKVVELVQSWKKDFKIFMV